MKTKKRAATLKKMPFTNGKRICKDCGFRIRGKEKNHQLGDHHKGLYSRGEK
jgi:hypothetical protein